MSIGHTTGRPVEILLVEDNPGDVRLTIEGLKEGKVHNNLHVARDGAEGTKQDCSFAGMVKSRGGGYQGRKAHCSPAGASGRTPIAAKFRLMP